jgi:uncharacterized repeat protein (TIGR03803 family)
LPPTAGGKAWALTTLWAFSGKDGAEPNAGLTADEDGVLYGTTAAGGDSTGCGTVFELTRPASGGKDWTLTTLRRFSGGDGCGPNGAVIVDKNGALYGTTAAGGPPSSVPACFGVSCGIVFKLAPPADGGTAYTEQVLWAFSGKNGAGPNAGLTAHRNGVLYGTAQNGGLLDGEPCSKYNGGSGIGCGVVFKLTGTGFVPR